MTDPHFVSPNEIRAKFSQAMSAMYQKEVPLYGDLLELVAETNRQVLREDAALAHCLQITGEIGRLAMERHGAIRVGTAQELHTLRRLFNVMGMSPVGYYDLAVAGVPVHSTAFRAQHESDLQASPFRIFTSLLRLELIENASLRELAQRLLDRRSIFTKRTLELIAQHENQGGLNGEQAQEFIVQALETFRWHRTATVSTHEYRQLHDQHRLIADVVAFRGPHINHLTPRTLDIDRVQAAMPGRGITPKAVIEGPPPRRCPILLRQTSFKALEEEVAFIEPDGHQVTGHHTARFGEIEQRGIALTPKGRALYDRLLQATQDALPAPPTEKNAPQYNQLLAENFQDFPDDYGALREQQLAWFRYFPTECGLAAKDTLDKHSTLEQLIALDYIRFQPLVYEDFLPVSAAGIFQSNLGDSHHVPFGAASSRMVFEQALGMKVIDELELYQQTQQRSLHACAQALGLSALKA
ncbi:putative glyoxalase superfamily metalloenzyme YdcJ [Serratia fonticola]|uniref:2-oxoadipate dioxygenase/decarboxylase n=1 Tax=Serratia fonticola TaxID=47917 RepID=A0A542BMX8_SERFO|nr:VOC family protein [Serratia fonticola]TQI79934.1 putative glyoxalase superfamily metalloenzyme YdcJ [Serratia fonticola]TQI98040.1 putative glyoxalase superfamily metalloenzyme YdcJ [Serratia fonticola]TVZ72535.1 putative glyoxalase superfamily metalloenzyme YdcJ [Serratia fonticola]